MTVNLDTTYLGLKLKSPIVASACPTNSSLPTLRRLEEAGCGAAVLPSLFEEQIEYEEAAFGSLTNSARTLLLKRRATSPNLTRTTPDLRTI